MTDDRPRHRQHRGPPGRPDRGDVDRTIATFPKSSIEEVRVTLSRFKGFDLVSARIWTDADEGGERRPTRKGITLRVERLPELLDALRQAEEEARKAGLLE